MQTNNTPCPVVVLISGSGSNLQTLIDQQQQGSLPIRIAAVISNKADALGLARAKRADIPQHVIEHQHYESREAFDKALIHHIDRYAPALVVLAGFMRILTPAFVERFQGRLLNIHPSLLPKYQGLNTHQRALDAGDTHHGVTVHFVTEELDGGPAVVQARLAINPQDNASSLAKRVQQQEHRIYPMAVRWFAQGRLRLQAQQVYLDDEVLPQTGRMIEAL